MTLQRITVVCIVALASFPAFVSARVEDARSRQAKLDEVARVMEPEKNEAIASLGDEADPFFSSRVSVAGVKSGGSDANVASVSLSPEAILAGAVDLLRPTGVMMGGTRRFIVSSLGDLYEVGKPIKVTLADGMHEVLVDAADSEGYVLRCGSTTISKKYIDNTGAGNSSK